MTPQDRNVFSAVTIVGLQDLLPQPSENGVQKIGGGSQIRLVQQSQISTVYESTFEPETGTVEELIIDNLLD
jgi:hypothetical protein